MSALTELEINGEVFRRPESDPHLFLLNGLLWKLLFIRFCLNLRYSYGVSMMKRCRSDTVGDAPHG